MVDKRFGTRGSTGAGEKSGWGGVIIDCYDIRSRKKKVRIKDVRKKWARREKRGGSPLQAADHKNEEMSTEKKKSVC